MPLFKHPTFNREINFLIYTIPFILVLLPQQLFALAGLAEKTSYFYYNDYTLIERGHPSDLCRGETKWCLNLWREDYQRFSNLDSSFEEINVPQDKSRSYIIGRRSQDNDWIVYDLHNEEVVIADSGYNNTLNAWLALGMQPPSYVNARNTRELLQETEDSIYSRWSTALQLWFFIGVLPFALVALVFWYLSRKSKQRYRITGSRAFNIFSYLLAAPVILIVYLATSSLISIIWNNW